MKLLLIYESLKREQQVLSFLDENLTIEQEPGYPINFYFKGKLVLRYFEETSHIAYPYQFADFLEKHFSIKKYDFKQFIRFWVEKKLGVRVHDLNWSRALSAQPKLKKISLMEASEKKREQICKFLDYFHPLYQQTQIYK